MSTAAMAGGEIDLGQAARRKGAMHPSAPLVWQTLRLIGACALAFLIAVALGLEERYWAMITAVIVTQPMLSDTLSASRDRVAGTLIGAAAGFLVLWLGLRGLPKLPLFWIVLVPVALLVAARPYLRLATVTLIVVVLVPGAGPVYAKPFARVVEILVGTLAAVVVSLLIRPSAWTRPH